MKRQQGEYCDWDGLGEKRRKCYTQETCGVCQSLPKEVTHTLMALARYIHHQLTIGDYKVTYRSVGSKILIRVSDENDPEETLQTPVCIWLSYQRSRVCDENRVTMEIRFCWPGWNGSKSGYSMVKEYVPVKHSGYWDDTHDNGVKYTPPYNRCVTIFNRIVGK